MARFEIPSGFTAQAYRFALSPTPAQAEALLSHAGGARFAYNTMLAAVKINVDQRAAERSYGIAERDLTPNLGWSFQSLRSRCGMRRGARMGFPRFKTKTGAVKNFSFTTGTIRVEPDRHHITLPRLGTIKTHESTRKLARRVEVGTASILRATFEAGRWHVSLRADRIHKLTTELAQTHAVIGDEMLAVKNMMAGGGARKRGFNRALGDAGLG